MKRLLAATTVLEAVFGVAFLIRPSALAQGLFGSTIPFVPALARLAGVVLLTIAGVSGLASRHPESRWARGVVWGLALYNFGTAGGFGGANLGWSVGGSFLWPALVLHAAMGVWCVTSLRRQPRPERSTAPRP